MSLQYTTFSGIISTHMSENDLIHEAQQGDKDAMDALITQYTPLLNKFMRSNKVAKESFNDVYQEIIIIFIDAVHKFKPEKDVKFITYAYNSLKYTFMNMSKKNKSPKAMHTKNSLSLNTPVLGTSDQSISVGDTIEAHNITRQIHALDTLECIKCLNTTEIDIINLSAQGYTYEEISEIIQRSTARIGYIKQNITKKIKKNRLDSQ